MMNINNFTTILLGLLLSFGINANPSILKGNLLTTHTETTNNGRQAELPLKKLHEKFRHFDIVELETDALYTLLQNSQGFHQIQFSEKYNWKVSLNKYDVFSADFRRTTATSYQKKSDFKKPDLINLRGYVEGTKQLSTLTISSKNCMAKIKVEDKVYSIEPLRYYLKEAKYNQYIIFETSNFIEQKNIENVCGQHGEVEQIESSITSNQSEKKNAVVCAQIAVAYDQSFKLLHGSADDAAFVLSARINNVAAFYRAQFEIDYKLVEIYESGFNEITPETNYTPCGGDDVCAEGSILLDFQDWGEGNTTGNPGFSSNPDLATFFTGKGVTENFGYSFLAAVCVDRSYNWVEEDNGYDETRKTNLWMHEIGHTWGASHVRQNNRNYMMRRTIPSTDNLIIHNGTYQAIIAHKDTRTCVSSGVCSDTNPPATNPSTIFTQYPFLNNFVDKDDCAGITIDVYNRVSYAFAIVTVNNQTVMYSSYFGDVFCYGIDCLEQYGLTDPDESYTCSTDPLPEPTCTDAIQNGDETGVDCGGSECESCPATCSDGIQNGNETGVDCGGSACDPCQATCSDGIQNGEETGVDCGGACPSCPTGNEPLIFVNYPFLNNYVDYSNCDATTIEIFDFGTYIFALVETNSGITMYSDYYDGIFCSGSDCATTYDLTNPNETWTCGMVNSGATCTDGIQNGNETGIDCGGGICAPCAITNCPANWFIDVNTPYQNLYESSSNITTNGSVTIENNQQIEYNANRVRINENFSVKAGAQFKVRTDGCE